jgi:pimeloyl-ACP methyl ester carboxylesterase
VQSCLRELSHFALILALKCSQISGQIQEVAIRACTIKIPLDSNVISELPALIVEPDSNQAAASILLFLHGKGEAGSSPGALPLVCVYQTPPFQALLGRLPDTLVITPQAPPVPTIDNWNWCEYVEAIAEFLADRYAKERVVATGFSRGGLGVLQLVSSYPHLVQAWAVIDPQPARHQAELNAVLPTPAVSERGWLRYGLFRNRDDSWKIFSALLSDRLPEENRDIAELPHAEMAVEAYYGSSLSADTDKKNLYDFLGLKFKPPPQFVPIRG